MGQNAMSALADSPGIKLEVGRGTDQVALTTIRMPSQPMPHATRQHEIAAQGVAPQPWFVRHGRTGGTSSFMISAITSSSCPTQVCPPWSNPTNFAIGIRLAVYFAVAYVP